MKTGPNKHGLRMVQTLGAFIAILGLYGNFSLSGSVLKAYSSMLLVVLGFTFVLGAQIDKLREEMELLKSRIKELEKNQ